MVVDALSIKALHVAFMMIKEYKLLERVRDLNLPIEIKLRSLSMSEVRMVRVIKKRIKES